MSETRVFCHAVPIKKKTDVFRDDMPFSEMVRVLYDKPLEQPSRDEPRRDTVVS